jgi:hypothetical protein
MDTSQKQIGLCNIPSYIYSLAGKQTFYEKFGFKNEFYTASVESFKKRTMQKVFRFHDIDAAYKDMTLAEVAETILKQCVDQKKKDEAHYEDEDIEGENFPDDETVASSLKMAEDLLIIMIDLYFDSSETTFSFDL